VILWRTARPGRCPQTEPILNNILTRIVHKIFINHKINKLKSCTKFQQGAEFTRASALPRKFSGFSPDLSTATGDKKSVTIAGNEQPTSSPPPFAAFGLTEAGSLIDWRRCVT
jgi:hypothetical protein